MHILDWWLFAIGAFFLWAGILMSWRQLRTGVARDGEHLGAKRYSLSTHPTVYWVLMLVNLLAVALGAWLIAMNVELGA